MPVNTYDFITAGLDRIEGWILDSNGVINGTSATTTKGATGNGYFRLYGAKALPLGVPEPETVPVTGDNAYLGGFVFPSAATRQFMLTAAVSGLKNNEYLGSGKFVNVGNSSLGFLDGKPFSPVDVALITVANAKSQQSGQVGQGLYTGYILAKVQGIPLGQETEQERAAGQFRYMFIVSLTDAFPWGETFNQSTHGYEAASYIAWSSNSRKSMFRFTGDGATQTFGPLPHTPASTDVNDIVVYVGGYRRYTGYTVNTAAKTITFTPAPADTASIVVYYDCAD